MNNLSDEFKDNPEVRQALNDVLGLLEEHPLVREFNNISAKIQSHPTLSDLTESIKIEQKEAVQFAHYDKPEAEKLALVEADRLTDEFNRHPLVVRYREVLIEVNDLLQYLTKKIEADFNFEVDKRLTAIDKRKN